MAPAHAAVAAAFSPDDLLRSVASLREKLWDAGFRPVAVYTAAAGRRLHHGKPGKHPFGIGWQNAARRNPPATVIDRPNFDATNTGILGDGLRAVDIDSDDQAAAARCVELARKTLGAAPTLYRSNSPRRLLLYRAAVGEPPKRKIKGSRGEIEVLGRGQQFVAFGDHESGAVLQWEGDAPGSVSREAAPAVTEDQITAYFEAVNAIIGCESPQQKTNGKNSNRGNPPPAPPSNPYRPLLVGAGTAYGLKALNEECIAVVVAPFGQQEITLNNAALKIGSLVAGGELGESYAFAELIAAGNAMPSQSRHAPWRAAEINKKVKRALEGGKRTPRAAPPRLAEADAEVDIYDAVFQALRHDGEAALARQSRRLAELSVRQLEGLIVGLKRMGAGGNLLLILAELLP
jgi:hypothetical protein